MNDENTIRESGSVVRTNSGMVLGMLCIALGRLAQVAAIVFLLGACWTLGSFIFRVFPVNDAEALWPIGAVLGWIIGVGQTDISGLSMIIVFLFGRRLASYGLRLREDAARLAAEESPRALRSACFVFLEGDDISYVRMGFTGTVLSVVLFSVAASRDTSQLLVTSTPATTSDAEGEVASDSQVRKTEIEEHLAAYDQLRQFAPARIMVLLSASLLSTLTGMFFGYFLVPCLNEWLPDVAAKRMGVLIEEESDADPTPVVALPTAEELKPITALVDDARELAKAAGQIAAQLAPIVQKIDERLTSLDRHEQLLSRSLGDLEVWVGELAPTLRDLSKGVAVASENQGVTAKSLGKIVTSLDENAKNLDAMVTRIGKDVGTPMTDISAAMKQMRNLLASVGLAWDRMTDREGSQEKLFENTAQAIEALTEQLNGFVETVPKDIEQLVQDQLQRQTAPDNLARQIHLLRNEIEEFKQHFEINSSQIPPESQRGVVVRALRSLFGGNGRQT